MARTSHPLNFLITVVFFICHRDAMWYRFTGNIKMADTSNGDKFTFFSHRRCILHFNIAAGNVYGNSTSDEYRGVAEFYGRPQIVIEDIKDHEDDLLEEFGNKTAQRSGRRDGDQSSMQSVGKSMTNDFICKIPVSIPKVCFAETRKTF